MTFSLGGIAKGGSIAMTSSWLGFVAQGDGTIGMFSLGSGSGAPTVLSPRIRLLDGGYAGGVVADPIDPAQGWALDPDVGLSGGIYSVRSDAVISSGNSDMHASGAGGGEQVLAIPGTVGLVFLPPAFDQALTISTDGTVRLITWPRSTERNGREWGHNVTASVAAFPDGQAVVSSACLSPDSRSLLVLDDNVFSRRGTRVASVAVDVSAMPPAAALQPGKPVADIEDPACAVCAVPPPLLRPPASRAGTPPLSGALVLSAQGNALALFAYNSSEANPWTFAGDLSPAPGSEDPELPSWAVQVPAGGCGDMGNQATVNSVVLTAEVGGIRQVQLNEDGSALDLGLTPLESGGLDGLIGAIGVALDIDLD